MTNEPPTSPGEAAASGGTPAHDFLLPRLIALIQEAEQRGFARDVTVAVLTDMITGASFNGAAPDPDADSAPQPDNAPGPSDAAQMFSEKNELIERVARPRGFI